MSDWTCVQGGEDFLSMYLSNTNPRTPQMNGGGSALQFSPSPTKPSACHNGISPVEQTTCSHSHLCDVDSRIAFLNQEVTSIGLPSLYDSNSETFAVACLVNCTYELLQKYQRSMRLREDAENRYQRSECDLEHLQHTMLRLREVLEQRGRELAASEEKARQATVKLKLLTAKHKAEKEEVKRLQSVIQHKDSQSKHEMKKKERELTKLKDRVHQLLTDRSDKKLGMEISSLVQRGNPKRGKWQSNKQEEELYRAVLSNYEQKQRELLEENVELRDALHSLHNLQRDVVAELNPIDSSPTSTGSDSPDNRHSRTKQALDDTDDEDEDKIAASDNLEKGHFHLTMDMLRENVLTNMKEQCHALKHGIRHMKNIQGANTSGNMGNISANSEEHLLKENDKLQKQMQKYRQIIEDQEELLMQNLMPVSEQVNLSFLNDSDIVEEKASLDRKVHMFDIERQQFERERKSFKDAAVRLNKERKSFDEEKSEFLKHQFLQLTPFRNRDSSATPATRQKSKSKRLLPTTPAHLACRLMTQDSGFGFSLDHVDSTPKSRILPQRAMTPTTVDLYRRMGLTPPIEVGDEHFTSDANSRLVTTCATPDIIMSPTQPLRRPYSALAHCAYGKQPTSHSRPHTAQSRQGNHTPEPSSPSSKSCAVSEHWNDVKSALFSRLSQAEMTHNEEF